MINLAAAAPAWSAVASMRFRRRHTNATILPDGKVLVTGGTSACGFTTESGAVYAASIAKVTLIRLVSTTHAFDMGQRLNTLTFTKAADGKSLTARAPASGRIAPPGPYMLFIVNDRGVPSVAQTILVSQ